MAVAAASIGGVAVPAAETVSLSSEPAPPRVATVEAGIPVNLREVSAYIVRRKKHHHHRHRSRFTGYTVAGRVSTFGPPLEGSSTTADGGTDSRPCIAIRNDGTLDRMFQVVDYVNHVRHVADLLQCDWGPAESTGRSIDISGAGAVLLHLDPNNFPTDSWGVARELKRAS